MKIDAKGQQYLRQSLGSRAMMNQNSAKMRLSAIPHYLSQVSE